MPSNKTTSSNQSQNPGNSAGQRVSRRTFLVAGLAAPIIVPRYVLGGPGKQAPSDKLRIAAVGVGGMGQSYLGSCRSENIVALCDLDHNLSGKVFQRFPGAKRYHDFRKMFEKEAENFDALIIATPDHTHAIILIEALRLNKHIYCAKPITHSIAEARKVRRVGSVPNKVPSAKGFPNTWIEPTAKKATSQTICFVVCFITYLLFTRLIFLRAIYRIQANIP